MSGFTVFFLCLCTAFIAISLAGHAYAPEQFPNIEWKRIAGWAMFMIAVILLD